MPKFNFALTSRHPEDIKEAIVEFDDIMYCGIEHNIYWESSHQYCGPIADVLTDFSFWFGLPLAQNVAPFISIML
jgi:hypothetical protein